MCNTIVYEAADVPLLLAYWYLIFKITRKSSLIPKEIKYNLHYDVLEKTKMVRFFFFFAHLSHAILRKFVSIKLWLNIPLIAMTGGMWL